MYIRRVERTVERQETEAVWKVQGRDITRCCGEAPAFFGGPPGAGALRVADDPGSIPGDGAM